jgi:hypothetical protein
MKRIEASSRSIHQTGHFHIDSDPEILYQQPGWHRTPNTDYRQNWAEEIWPDCRLDRRLSTPEAARADVLTPHAGSPD